MSSQKTAGEEQVRTILVVGSTGAGKSELIKQLGGRHVETGEPPETSQGFLSCTKEVATYNVGVYGGARYHFVDMMGMLDSNGKERKGLGSVAQLLKQLATVVGVVYVVAGRMNPQEMESCNFLLDEFFHDLHPKRLLVVRTKVNYWKSYNAQSDKDDLKQLEGVSKRFLAANFVAVNFDPDKDPAVLWIMTTKIKEHAQSWKTHVKLSDKTQAALDYRTNQERLKELEEEVEKTRKEEARREKARKEKAREEKAKQEKELEEMRKRDAYFAGGTLGAWVGIWGTAAVAEAGAGAAAGTLASAISAGVGAGGLAAGCTLLAGAAVATVPALLLTGAILKWKKK